ncbi:hypothetical protein FEM48_Zijuj09G0038500 [Ziziphus jujuba var. spinosa]|uniref:Uncharacterized protein n=1 Tax=Ziziphus jujuba var. spinosa TaxID=714518 RepID=A0A978UQR0_ZIZJJ|nr:hypothetical protein FEM48_Zijuj09G0038500 [Ziziphus jujuba var. spinosa]
MSEDSSSRTPCLETKTGSTQIVGSNSKPCVSELDPDQRNDRQTCSFTSTTSNKYAKVTSNEDANKARWKSEGSQYNTSETEKVYVHDPIFKRCPTEFRKVGMKIWTEIPFSETGSESVRMADSSGFHYTELSKTSLDMCTEIVGSESGY